MRCKTCGEPAAINKRQHKLALCGEHFTEWLVSRTEKIIEKYAMFGHDERILLAVSGGKDSLALWDVLLRLGYDVEVLYIDLGIGDVRPAERQPGHHLQAGQVTALA